MGRVSWCQHLYFRGGGMEYLRGESDLRLPSFMFFVLFCQGFMGREPLSHSVLDFQVRPDLKKGFGA